MYLLYFDVCLKIYDSGFVSCRQAERNEDAENYYKEAAKLRPNVSVSESTASGDVELSPCQKF